MGGAVQLCGQVQLEAHPSAIEGGGLSRLELAAPLAFQPGREGRFWRWALEGEARGGQLIKHEGMVAFRGPRVKVPTTFQVRATHEQNAELTAVATILVRPELTLTTVTPTLVSGASAEIRMMRGQEEILDPIQALSPYMWEVVKHWVVPHGETVQAQMDSEEMHAFLTNTDEGRTCFKAPQVLTPTRYRMEVFKAHAPGPVATLDLLVQPSATIMPVDKLKQTLLAGDTVRLKAKRWDDQPAIWLWDSNTNQVEPDGHDSSQAVFTAPMVDAARTFWVEASDEHSPAAGFLEIHVLPRIPGLPKEIADRMTAQMGQNWMAPVPSMFPFAGKVAPLEQGLTPTFKDVSAIAFVEDPGLPGLHRQWLMADPFGIQVVPYLGKTATPLPGARGKVTALAVRPGRVSARNHRHLVFALEQEPASARGGAAQDPGACVLHLAPSGAIQLLAGATTTEEGGTLFQDGAGPAARFGVIRGLAMDGNGTVFVADAGNRLIRTIGSDGVVATLAGNMATFRLAEDGRGAGASFQDLKAMTLDPATHDLFVADGTRIRKVTRAGEVTTLVDLAQAWEVTQGSTAIGLSCQGNRLFIAIAEGNEVVSLDLTSLVPRLLAGHEPEKVTRMGPLGAFSPDLAPGACAALARPVAVATNADGMCLVALDEGLVQLDLHTRDAHAWMRRFKKPAPPAAAAAAAASSRQGKRRVEEEHGTAMDLSPGPASAASSSSIESPSKRQHLEATDPRK